jgi:hypothetical protein
MTDEPDHGQNQEPDTNDWGGAQSQEPDSDAGWGVSMTDKPDHGRESTAATKPKAASGKGMSIQEAKSTKRARRVKAKARRTADMQQRPISGKPMSPDSDSSTTDEPEAPPSTQTKAIQWGGDARTYALLSEINGADTLSDADSEDSDFTSFEVWTPPWKF